MGNESYLNDNYQINHDTRHQSATLNTDIAGFLERMRQSASNSQMVQEMPHPSTAPIALDGTRGIRFKQSTHVNETRNVYNVQPPIDLHSVMGFEYMRVLQQQGILSGILLQQGQDCQRETQTTVQVAEPLKQFGSIDVCESLIELRHGPSTSGNDGDMASRQKGQGLEHQHSPTTRIEQRHDPSSRIDDAKTDTNRQIRSRDDLIRSLLVALKDMDSEHVEAFRERLRGQALAYKVLNTLFPS